MTFSLHSPSVSCTMSAMKTVLNEPDAISLLSKYSPNVKLVRQDSGNYRLENNISTWEFPLILGELLFAFAYVAHEGSDQIRDDFPSFIDYVMNRQKR